MKTYVVKVEQNGGEYYGYVTIKCKSIDVIGFKKIKADGVEIEFDEVVMNVFTKSE
jgi:hypothetical protein